ncbi:ATP-binding cassette domain-containing protein [Kamptonema cortianum]|nr:ATP-binding cassette domain-containing protein [Geitlerinema splendidum]MDK3158847.1 ATP-binding cassette domain-containing protein [Kamptonema cortianum]
MVETNNICKTFSETKGKETRAVVDVDFKAKPGQIHALLGVNGAGKTTLLRMLSTVIRPTSGSATVNGFDVVKSSADARSSIGFMSTTTALYGRLTPREMLAYFGGLYGMQGARLSSRIEEVLQLLDASSFADKLCDRLSTGQKQRVSIARTILHDPPILFFDEPTAGLDILASQTVLEQIERARSSGKVVIFSTHIMSEVERLADQITIIHEGRIRASGTTESLRELSGLQSLEQVFLHFIGGSVDGVSHP